MEEVIGLDTNVIVRYLTQDNDTQSPLASRLLDSLNTENRAFISVIALVETTWVLRSFYGSTRHQIQRVVESLLRASGIVVERSDLVWLALGEYKRGTADFSDCLMECCGRAAACDYTITFDRDAASSGMKLLR